MATQINDILLWIESPGHFEKGIGKLSSVEEISSKQTLLSQFLEKSSEGWSKMTIEQLEKTYNSLLNIQYGCKTLADKFYSDIDIYEKGYFEVITPHEWEGLPPKDGKPEVIEAAIKRYYEQQQESIERTKATIKEITFNVRGCYRIANAWYEETIRYGAMIRRMADEKSLVGSEHKVDKAAELGSVTIPSLKPKKGLDYYSGLPKLRAGFIEIELISPEVELPEIRALFGFNEMTTCFPWKGPRVALRQFIQDLLELKKIEEFPSRKKWETVNKIFVLEDEPHKAIGSLQNDNGVYDNKEILRGLIKDL